MVLSYILPAIFIFIYIIKASSASREFRIVLKEDEMYYIQAKNNIFDHWSDAYTSGGKLYYWSQDKWSDIRGFKTMKEAQAAVKAHKKHHDRGGKIIEVIKNSDDDYV